MPGYVTSRHGAGTHVADRPPQRRGTEALAGIVSEMLRRAAHAGFTADELAAATFAAATERKRPGPLVHVLFTECTSADAGYDAERLVDAFPGMIEAEGALLDDLPERLDRFHYDLVATTTFHADEAQALVAGRVPVVAMLVGPGLRRDGPRDRRAAAAARGSGSSAPRSAARTTCSRRSRCRGRGRRDRVGAHRRRRRARTGRPDRGHHPAVARGAGGGLADRFARPERIRSWTYEFDPSGLELLRRAIEHVAATGTPRPRPPPRRHARLIRASGSASRGPRQAHDATRACHASGMRAFHVQRSARERYGIDGTLLGSRGDLVDDRHRRHPARSRHRMNAARPRRGARRSRPARSARSGCSTRSATWSSPATRPTAGPVPCRRAVDALDDRSGRTRLACSTGSRRSSRGPGRTRSRRPDRLEELLLIRVANENPALGPLRELVDDRPLERATRYREAIAGLEAVFAGEPADRPRRRVAHRAAAHAGRARADLAGRPAALHPRPLGRAARRRPRRAHRSPRHRHRDPRRGGARRSTCGSGRGRRRAARPTEAPSFGGAAEEPEAFSSDSAWMPRVVLMAKSTYVWLDQLSRAYGREIRTLDAIPDEELDTLARWGVTGLWLIGLWERSKASERIKRMRGNAGRGRLGLLARRLPDRRRPRRRGGLREPARPGLGARHPARERHGAQPHGHRLALGHRAPGVVPVARRSRPTRPTPSAAPDLSSDERVGIVLEDHYWDDSDAAVVFKRFDRWTGDERYVYHGNDGTSFPWNDTAQLDFLDPAVREQVIQTILDVARRFPIIRFDAAMVLAKKHIRAAVVAGARARAAASRRAPSTRIPKAEFDARMPVEFWREVVDRVAAEVPDTLLLAEAFWLLEGYFVRTLGHAPRLQQRVHAHAPRRGRRRATGKVIKETLEFDPEILKRYVNFMSNPDEKTALEQFGKGDKYFGVATVLATLPGLPMLGHGQVEGFGEKYGMEFRRATLDEQPDPWLVERHEREIFPLLHRRGVVRRGARLPAVRPRDRRRRRRRARLRLLERRRAGALARPVPRPVRVDERLDPRLGGRTRARRRTARSGSSGGRSPRAWACRTTRRRSWRSATRGPGSSPSARAARSGSAASHVSLEAYERHVFWEFREVHDGAPGQWARLAARLGGRRRAVARGGAARAPARAGPRAVPGGLRRRARRGRPRRHGDAGAARRARAPVRGVPRRRSPRRPASTGDPDAARRRARVRSARRPSLTGRRTRAGRPRATGPRCSRWLALSRTGRARARRRRRGDEPGLVRRAAPRRAARRGPARGRPRRGRGVGRRRPGPRAARAPAARPRSRARARPPMPGSLERWLADDVVRTAMGVNTWEGVEWLDRDRFDEPARWAVRLDAIDTGSPPDLARVAAWRRRRRLPAIASIAPPRAGRRGHADETRRSTVAGRATDDPKGPRRHAGPPRDLGAAGRARRISGPAVRRRLLSRTAIRRSSEVGGAPCAMTDSRCVR